MPRDRKGQPFGIDSIVSTPKGQIKVCGFSVNNGPLTPEQMQNMAKMGCATHNHPHDPVSFYWYQVEVLDPLDNPWTKHAAHTDTCHADVAQRDGVTLPDEASAIPAALNQYSPEAGLACKVVWGC